MELESGEEQYQIDALLSSYRWNQTSVTYSFFEDDFGGFYYGSETGVAEVNEAIKGNVRNAIEDLQQYINLDFVEVPDTANSYGEIRYQLSNGPAYAYAYYPTGISDLAGDIHFTPTFGNESLGGFSVEPGTYAYLTIIHETGHTLGLKHPGNYNGIDVETPPFLTYAEDNTTNTVMSYNDAGSNAVTFMPYDIRALQDLYGARVYNPGNNTYNFRRVDLYEVNGELSHNSFGNVKQTIWDSGGIDTLNFSSLALSSGYRIDLTEGAIITTQNAYNSTAYQPIGSPEGSIYYTTGHGTAIAFDTIIENVIGSSSNDEIIGNSAANLLQGGGGDDYLVGVDRDSLTPGLGEIDDLIGGAGGDTFVLGDSSRIYYDDGNPNSLGYSDYARITGFNPLEDTIELYGRAENYRLRRMAGGTGILLETAAIDEGIALISGVTNLDLNADYFSFV